MATVTRESIGLLNDKLVVTIAKEDYIDKFEQSLKKQAKNANIPGFRKGMVPAGLVKKMYGQSVLTEEVIRLAEKQLFDYLETEKLDIFAQPLPLEFDSNKIEINNPSDYTFSFEVGLKPDFSINPSSFNVIKYVIDIEDKVIDEELSRLRTRHGKMTEPEAVTNDDNVLNVLFTQTDENGVAIENGISKTNSLLVKYFKKDFKDNLMGKKNGDTITLQPNNAFEEKELDYILQDLGLDKTGGDINFNITITKVGYVEQADVNEEFFSAAFPNREIKNEDECRKVIKEEINAAYAAQSRNQLHDQLYHQLLDNTNIEFPEAFLKRWLQTSGEKQKTTEETEAEFPSFVNSLKWTLVSSKVATDNNVQVLPDDIKLFAKNQLFSYMGMSGDDQPWIEEYVNRMMKDKKFVEDSFYKIQTDKMFAALESQVNAKEESISFEEFSKKLHHHHH